MHITDVHHRDEAQLARTRLRKQYLRVAIANMAIGLMTGGTLGALLGYLAGT